MNGDEFAQAHAKWRYGTKKEKKPEAPGTFLMTEAGCYFRFEGDIEAEIKRLSENGLKCTVHENQTSMTMCQIQAKLRGFKDEPTCIQKL